MHTRSKGKQHLHPFTDEINQLQRQIRSSRKHRLTDQMDNPDQVNQHNFPPGEGQHQQGIVPPLGYAPPPAQPQRRGRPIRAGDAPRPHTIGHGIAPPPIATNNFEIKGTTLTLVQNQKFHGLPVENPIKHLDGFEQICNLTKLNGVSEDAYKLRLFPFSLGDRAQEWAARLPPGSITTWVACKDAFLAKFFSTTRTAQLRSQISSFTQKNSETFSEAWERFRNYITQCPHHNFTEESLLSTLYRGVLPRFRMHLDTASNGSFLNRDVESGWELLENMAATDGNYDEEYDRSNRGPSESNPVSQRQLDALNAKLDKLLSVSTKHIHMVSEDASLDYDDDAAMNEEICYMQNQGNFSQQQGNFRPSQNNYPQNQGNFRPNQGNFNAYKPNPNLSYRNNNVANPQDQTYPPQQQQFQPRSYPPKQQYNNTYKAAPAIPPGYQPPQAPHQAAPAPDVTTILQQLLHGQTALRNELTSKIDANHTEMTNKFEQLNSRLKYVESQQASSSVKTSGQLPGKSIQNPKEYGVNAITLVSSHDLDDVAMDDTITEDSNVEEGEANLSTVTAQTLTTESEDANNVVEDSPLNLSTLQSICQGKADISVEVPVHSTLDAEPTRPSGGRVMPTLTDTIAPPEHSRSECLDEYNNLPHKPLQVLGVRSDLEKLDDPGALTLPCSIGRTSFPKCICDSGASVSVMPFSVANRLGLSNYKSCDYSLLLADRTLRAPVGLLENVPLRIGGVVVPTDFIVLNIHDEPKDPILLGRPFLASTKALINMASGTIELNLGENNRVRFRTNGTDRTPPIRPPDAQPETPESTITPTIMLEPTAYRDGAIEYRVKNGRRPTPLELVTHLYPHRLITTGSSGPFGIQEIKPCGSITLAIAENATLPFTGQKVKLYLVESERTPPPLPKPPI